MNLYLFLIPGALFLLVVFFRVGLPYLKHAPWKRMVDSARYYRHMEKPEKSDRILERAVERYPDIPPVYIEFFLNHSDSADLQRRMNVLLQGLERTGDPALAFFAGNAYFENGDFPDAEKLLDTEACRRYMIDHRVPLLAQLRYEQGKLAEAEREYLLFYRAVFPGIADERKLLGDLSPRELATYVLMLKAAGKEWKQVMGLVPASSFHSDMSWKDYLSQLREDFKALKPAVSGISGDPSAFNRRRKAFYRERIALVEAYFQD